jgi:D-alanine-D-alanine ligase
MKIGITYDLKAEVPAQAGQPEDFQEEFDSPVTIEAIAAVLRSLEHEVVKLGDGRELLERLLADPPEFVFNLAEGQGVSRSREARVPAALEMLGIPYTGSDPLTLAVTLDKDCAKRLVLSRGVVVPRGMVVYPHDSLNAVAQIRHAYPVIVKPAWEGSSKGIRAHCVVDDPGKLAAVIESLRRDHRQPIMIEEFIDGDELTVGIIGNDPPRVVGTMRVLPQLREERFVYGLEVKRDWRHRVRYETPAQLTPTESSAVVNAALTAYQVLGCRDVARVDFRLRDGVAYFLEANPLPGLNPESSDLILLAQGCGWTYGQLIEAILHAGLDRQRK